MIFVALMLHAPALAFDAACTAPVVEGSIPEPGASRVAADQPFALLLASDACHSGLGFALVDGGGRSVPAPFVQIQRGATILYRASGQVLPPGPYVLRIRNNEVTDLPFQVIEEAWSPPDLILYSFDSVITSVDDLGILVGEADVTTVAAPDVIVHWSGDPTPSGPWFATLGRGAPHTVRIDPWSDTDELCVHVRLEGADGQLTPWSTRCEPIAPPDEKPPEDTGTPPEESLPVDTGYFWLDSGYYWGEYWYDDRSGFTLFACGGCATPREPPTALLFLPWLVALRRRR